MSETFGLSLVSRDEFSNPKRRFIAFTLIETLSSILIFTIQFTAEICLVQFAPNQKIRTHQ